MATCKLTVQKMALNQHGRVLFLSTNNNAPGYQNRIPFELDPCSPGSVFDRFICAEWIIPKGRNLCFGAALRILQQ